MMLFFRNVVNYVTKYSELEYILENDKLVIKNYYKQSAGEREAFEEYVRQRGVRVYRILSFKKVPLERFSELIRKVKDYCKQIDTPLEEIDNAKFPDYKDKSYRVPERLYGIDYYKNGSLLVSGRMQDVAVIMRFRPNLREFIKSDNLIIEVEERDGKPIGESVKSIWSQVFTTMTKEIESNSVSED